MAAQDRFGYPNQDRPPGGGAYNVDFTGERAPGRRTRQRPQASGDNPATQAQYQTGRQYEQGRQGDSRRALPRLGVSSSNRQNVYGSNNPYQNSTNQNPYVGIAWLGSGFPHALPLVPPAAPRAPAFQPVQPGGARPSWDLAGIAALLGPYWHVPIREDYQLNWKVREAVPMIDAAILRMKDLVGFPEIEASPRLKKDIDDFLQYLPVNRIQFGAETWLRSHLDNAYTFGRAHTEILLTADKKDVFGLTEVYTPTCGLRPTFDGFAINVVQYQYGGGVPLTLVPELLLTSVHDFRGDDPNGNSLIASLPFVSQVLIKMYDSIRQQWERFGTPNYWVNVEPPENWNDPEGTQASAILAPMQQSLYQSDLDRTKGLIRHFWTAGKVTLQVMGADGHVLEFSDTARSLCEQITAKIGLPPFLLGFSWSSTERMSTAQAKTLTEVIEAARSMVEPQIRQLIMLRQRLVGRTGAFTLKWPKVSLQDLIDEARARWMDAQSEQIMLANWDRKVRLGINSIEEMAQALRPDMEDVPLVKIRSMLNGEQGLPSLPEELPELMPAPVGGDFPGGPGGNHPGGQQGGQPPGGNNPRDEQTRQFWVDEVKEMVGNGKH